ncbi:unnamed protein product [Ranitomeya imitator]|uniref:Uncharacterized protein n=1 Tax=Ranitomeya imitator TaxID=111125 RepID=A0ABN9L743_9NEOB|nr:unnamed protein product [Ranitomeya imitator]
MASHFNAKVSNFMARKHDLRLLGADALVQDWTQFQLLYIFPPLPLISRVVRKIKQEGVPTILIALDWPRRSWYADIVQLTADAPWRLPVRSDLLSQGPFYHQNSGALNLTMTTRNGDLNLVLTASQEPPFEPLKEVPLHLLSQKVVFLVAITSLRRVAARVCQLPKLPLPDSDDEILVHKKSKSKKVLEESDSDPECDTNVITNTEPSLKSDEENKPTDRVKPRRIRAALLDSDDSDGDLVANDEVIDVGATSDKGSPQKDTSTGLEMKEKSKSKRRSEKERKKMAAIENIKKYKKQNRYGRESASFKCDSGCLLADGDLFDKDEESDNPEEESLDAIRASVKGRLKSHSSHLSDGAEEEDMFKEKVTESAKRKERKAARVSKEAIKQLHSETQRLLRESAVSLPYHLPQPKSIHDFFKRRSRPVCQGNAMQLIKSSTYHLLTAEDKMETNTKLAEHASFDPASAAEHDVNSELPLQNSQAAVLEEAVTDTASHGECQSVGNLEDKAIDVDNSEKSTLFSATVDAFNNQESKCCSDETTTEVLQDVSEPELKSTTLDHGDETENSCSNVTVAQEKPKISKLEKLRALGIDLSIKPRLCPDDGSFVNLDEPKPNKGT